jgi:hypothetical protein
LLLLSITYLTLQIFLGGTNTIVMHNTCEDSLLAAPIILDLIILAELISRIELKKDGEAAFHGFHPVAVLLSYLTKAPLVPQVCILVGVGSSDGYVEHGGIHTLHLVLSCCGFDWFGSGFGNGLDFIFLDELLMRIELKKDGEAAFHGFHPVAVLLSYLTKAPLVPQVRAEQGYFP